MKKLLGLFTAGLALGLWACGGDSGVSSNGAGDDVKIEESSSFEGNVSSSNISISSSETEVLEASSSSESLISSSADAPASSSTEVPVSSSFEVFVPISSANSSSDVSEISSDSDSGLTESSSSYVVEENSSSSIVFGVMTDERDGRTYKTVVIGRQTWMAENLNYAYKEPTSSLDSSSFCYLDDPEQCAKFGRLYLWSAAMDSAAIFGENGKDCGYSKTCSARYPVRGICPEGWHLPDSTEMVELLTFAALEIDSDGDFTDAGVRLKACDSWASSCIDYGGGNERCKSGNGTDDFGFSALAGGYVNEGRYRYRGYNGYFWSSSEFSMDAAVSMGMLNDRSYAFINHMSGNKDEGRSIRCIKD
ncbi:fibrobacter succinogenes major paralogous domain-containing protein [Fibrobacter sp. HC4]|uniref:fibrobacter succinogenes major paralogous domain-containing protein n=1 Tax=Fibrobacter sp. HC4 TaxID=3239812 RepID=UPI00201A0E0A|nr:fibrobacter succinogenes major paralogous domain-containing protein [Fibrobacter succinogenes]MCL4102700.1 hypothetical protein [Fibrobacter succinogenes]MDO4948311.1 fibrobacter succinogenes major paralogous domain-containing protein [Fibrobacter sp.]